MEHDRPTSGPTPLERVVKRLFDIIVSLGGIVVLAPMMLTIALILKVSQGGEVFYRGKRTGQNGRSFEILKFRSMIPNAERLGGTTTGKDDPRLTKLGKLLRRYKLDELPQFFNVLKGDMSIVGPRPEVSEYTDLYSPEEMRILSVKPGITDIASLEFNDLQEVVGNQAPDDYFRQYVLPRKNELRLKYVDQWSVRSDLRILALTTILVASKPFRRGS